jgi:Glyoxalase-like domain
MIIDIDHLLSYVSSLEAAAETYRRLGFTLTPVSDITAMGIVNQLVTFRPRTAGTASFIELMAVSDAAKLPPPMQPLLSGFEGGKSMVLATSDAPATHKHLTALGYPFAPPVHVKREWKIAPDASVFPEFDVLLPLTTPLPFNACHYRDPDVYVRQAWLAHPNTARHLDALIAIVPTAEPLARAFEHVLGASFIKTGDGVFAGSPGHTRLELHDRASAPSHLIQRGRNAARALYCGVRLLVDDIEVCRRCIVQSGLAHTIDGADVVVTADSCHGVALVFRQAHEQIRG